MNDQNRISEERIRRNRIRRNRQLRRRMMLAGYIMTAAMFVLIFAFNGMMTDAHEQDRPEIYKYYRSEIVLPGDTVENASDHYLSEAERALIEEEAAYRAEIRSINHLGLHEEPAAGTRIVIPYYSTQFVMN